MKLCQSMQPTPLTVNPGVKESVVFVDDGEEIQDPLEPFAESVEFSKDVLLRELEGRLLVLPQSFLGRDVSPTVFGIQLEAVIQLFLDQVSRLRPHRFHSMIRHVTLACPYHLVRDLLEVEREKPPAVLK